MIDLPPDPNKVLIMKLRKSLYLFFYNKLHTPVSPQ